MTENMICEKCGAVMEKADPNLPIGMLCPKCGWGWVTSYIEPIYTDHTLYRVILLPDTPYSKDNLLLIAEIAGINILQAKKVFEDIPTDIYSGKAVEVKEVIQKLEEKSISFKIEPEFPY